MITAYLQMAFALAAVIGLIVVMGFFLKKRQQMTGSMMKVVAHQSLGPRKGLIAVKVGTEVLLLGVTPSDVRLLRTYESDDIKVEPVVKETGDKLKKLKQLKETLYDHQ